MGLIVSTLITACAMSSSSMSQEACEKATQAGLTQLGISQQVDSAEEHEVKIIEKRAKENLGDEGVMAVATTYFVARTAKTKSVTFGLPTLGLCDSIKVDVNQDTQLLRFEWRF